MNCTDITTSHVGEKGDGNKVDNGFIQGIWTDGRLNCKNKCDYNYDESNQTGIQSDTNQTIEKEKISLIRFSHFFHYTTTPYILLLVPLVQD